MIFCISLRNTATRSANSSYSLLSQTSMRRWLLAFLRIEQVPPLLLTKMCSGVTQPTIAHPRRIQSLDAGMCARHLTLEPFSLVC